MMHTDQAELHADQKISYYELAYNYYQQYLKSNSEADLSLSIGFFYTAIGAQDKVLCAHFWLAEICQQNISLPGGIPENQVNFHLSKIVELICQDKKNLDSLKILEHQQIKRLFQLLYEQAYQGEFDREKLKQF